LLLALGNYPQPFLEGEFLQVPIVDATAQNNAQDRVRDDVIGRQLDLGELFLDFLGRLIAEVLSALPHAFSLLLGFAFLAHEQFGGDAVDE